MDAVDRKILAEVQRDGRQTLNQLADRVGLSVSPCQRRLRHLEKTGVISGYRAHLNTASIGLGFEAFVFVTMRGADRPTLDAFETAVASLPNVLEAQRLFGDPDYLLRVITRDLAHFRTIYDDNIATLPGVGTLRSTLVMKSVVRDGALPL